MVKRQTFLVHIIENQNATWQGEITWLDEEKKESFRSLLELIKLMVAREEGMRGLVEGKVGKWCGAYLADNK